MTDEARAQKIVHDVAVAVALVEGEAGVGDVIRIVGALEPVGVRRISRASELPVPIVAAVCAELRKRGVVARERPVQLTPFGRQLWGERGRPERDSSACPSCEGTEVFVPEELAGVAAELRRIANSAPRARMEIDQSHCTIATKLRRALLMHEVGALRGRRVLLLGDDDLMSIAIERVARHLGFDASILKLTILDIDPAVLAFCRPRLATASFRVAVVHHDLRKPLPPGLTGRFDTVVTDPPYTAEGAELFLSRAAAALSQSGRGNIFFSFGMKTPDELLRVQSAIAGMGFVIRRLVRNFNEYEGAGTLGGTSHLYHLSSTTVTRPIVANGHTGALYTGDKRRTRRYRCGSCGAVEMVGPGQRWTTVADLKTQGCPRCRATTFRPLPRADRLQARPR
jgi:predicted methyltransferase